MRKKINSRNAFLVIIATVVLGTPITASSQATDRQEVRRLVQKMHSCGTDEACGETCKSAVDQRDSTEFRGLAEKCNELHTAFSQRRDPASADGSILNEGYSWMADVDAVVGSPPLAQQRAGIHYDLVAEGREDWIQNCPSHRGSTRNFLVDRPTLDELRVPGTKVRLKQIQYKKGACIVGQVEILGK